MMKYKEVLDLVKSMKDDDFKKFNSKIVPTCKKDMIGVRTPKLRKIAKIISKEKGIEYLDTWQYNYFEDMLLYSYVLQYSKLEFRDKLNYFDFAAINVDNWAACDALCSSFKEVQNHKSDIWLYLDKYVASSKEYDQRIASVMFLCYFSKDKDYIDDVLEKLTYLKNEGYYTKMGVAWCLSVCYIHYPEKTYEYLEECNFSMDILKMTVRKIKDSYRVCDDMKIKISKKIINL